MTKKKAIIAAAATIATCGTAGFIVGKTIKKAMKLEKEIDSNDGPDVSCTITSGTTKRYTFKYRNGRTVEVEVIGDLSISAQDRIARLEPDWRIVQRVSSVLVSEDVVLSEFSYKLGII